jgi:ABC-type hemin transport system ATPase subunit
MNKGRIVKVGSAKEVFEDEVTRESFDFKALIDENPFDGSPRLTLGRKK